MPSLQERLGSILRDVLPVEDEPDGGLTVHHDATFASLRVVNIAEGLDLVSLTQIVAWDLPLTKKLSDQVAKQAHDSNFGNVTMVEKVSDKAAQRNSGKGASKTAEFTPINPSSSAWAKQLAETKIKPAAVVAATTPPVVVSNDQRAVRRSVQAAR